MFFSSLPSSLNLTIFHRFSAPLPSKTRPEGKKDPPEHKCDHPKKKRKVSPSVPGSVGDGHSFPE